ncbi:MAG TPA: leucine-rich repeat domain-containing protein [Oscillospiraceae bacterium]|nr:leucine-rich repeat domain-containing protein [Oscillospiraceae bacterium]HPS35550.1 leucine-rich repeat domain-containing protein [Oscillospiraceae bacterium]
MKRIIAIFMILVFLAGCSVQSVSVWSRPSVPAFEPSTPSKYVKPLKPLPGLVSKIVTAKSGEFEYRLDESGNAVITAWFGNGAILTLPGKLDGHTVKGFGIYGEENGEQALMKIQKIILGSDVSFFPTGLLWRWRESPLSLEVEPQNPYLTVVDGILFNREMTVLYMFPKERTGVYTVPESVKEIGDEAFYHSLLTEITLSKGLERIGHSAFDSSTLTSTQVPETVCYVGNNAFNNCYDLTDIYVLNGDIEMPDSFPVNYNTKIHTSAGSALHKYAFDNYILVETENNQFFSDPYIYTEKTKESATLPDIAVNPSTAGVAP